MTIALALLAALALATAVWLAGTVAAASLLCVPVKSLAFGLGPTFATVPLGRLSLELKPFPVASNVIFLEREHVPAGVRAFATLDRGRKILLALSGCVATLVAAMLVLGSQRALDAFVATWIEVLRPVMYLFDAKAHWQPMVDAAHANPFAILAALACAKVSAFNLLPLAGLSGWTALQIAAGEPSSATDTYAKFSLFVLLGLIFLWGLSGAEFLAQAVGFLR